MLPLFSPQHHTAPQLGPWQWVFSTVPHHPDPMDHPQGTYWQAYVGMNPHVYEEHQEQVRQGNHIVIELRPKGSHGLDLVTVRTPSYSTTMFDVPVVHVWGLSRQLFTALLDGRQESVSQQFELRLLWKHTLNAEERRTWLNYQLECYARFLVEKTDFDYTHVAFKRWFNLESGLQRNPDQLDAWMEYGLVDAETLALTDVGVRELADAITRVREGRLTTPPVPPGEEQQFLGRF